MYKPKLQMVFKNKWSRVGIIIVLIIMTAIAFWFIDRQELTVNFSLTYAIIELVLHVFLSLGLAMLVAIFIAKPRFKKNPSLLGGIGAVFGAVITGCPVCGVTLMSMLGIVGALSFLPWFGLEIKLFSIFMLLWSIDYSLRNFDTCSKKFFQGIFPSWKKTLLSLGVFVGIILGITYLLNQAEWLRVPEYKVKMLFPDSYSAFWYDLSEGCSDTKMFWEFYGQDRDFMLKEMKIFNHEGAVEFDKCLAGDEYAMGEITSNVFQELIDLWNTVEKNIVDINGRKFIFEKQDCLEGTCSIKIWTVEQGSLLIIKAKYYEENIIELEKSIYNELENLHIKKL